MNNSQYDEKSLLLEISCGAEKSFNLLFEKYRNRLFTYLCKITKSRETAEEIVLDVFLKLWHGREGLVEIENLEAFLFRVVIIGYSGRLDHAVPCALEHQVV